MFGWTIAFNWNRRKVAHKSALTTSASKSNWATIHLRLMRSFICDACGWYKSSSVLPTKGFYILFVIYDNLHAVVWTTNNNSNVLMSLCQAVGCSFRSSFPVQQVWMASWPDQVRPLSLSQHKSCLSAFMEIISVIFFFVWNIFL